MSRTSLYKGDLRAYFKSKDGEKSSNVEDNITAEISMAEEEMRIKSNRMQGSMP